MKTEKLLVGTRREFEEKYKHSREFPGVLSITSELDRIEAKQFPKMGMIFYRVEHMIPSSDPASRQFDIQISIECDLIWIKDDLTDEKYTTL